MIVRKAKLSDVEQIHEIVNYYAEKGMMLSRARSMLYEHIRDFVVAEEDGEILGTGALHVLWIDLAELRTLAVKENLLSKGIGSKIVDFILEEAKELGIPKVFTLTYQPGFFEKHGFNVIQKESMPHKVWTDCINCPKFPNCNEVCLEKIIDL
ncbi:amino-acid acetyltransferase [Oxobacter pfennigii]|uniref:Amino-acid acetyltransferase n=1 Tax=Oxobacter pfennigii TaxID=36849 RepID=A0A0P8X405_9CLOT|nr:amino-acid acetyltransferase [Oxobacter pfennigii]